MTTEKSVQQANQIADLLGQGFGYRHIAETLGVSRVRVSQIVCHTFPDARRHPQANPALRAYRPPVETLTYYRRHLIEIRSELATLRREVERELRVLDEEIESARIDDLLGLRG